MGRSERSAILETCRDYAHMGLLAAVIERAVQDAQAGEIEAELWLRSGDCRAFLQDLGLPPDEARARQVDLLALPDQGEQKKEEGAN